MAAIPNRELAGDPTSLRTASVIDVEFQPTVSAAAWTTFGNLSWPRGAIAIIGFPNSCAASISDRIHPLCAAYIPANINKQSAFLIFSSNWRMTLRCDLGSSADRGRGWLNGTLRFYHLKLLSAFRRFTTPSYSSLYSQA
jgi:hypothetical protein